MLSNEDRRAIEGLFIRLGDVQRRAEPRDPDAEALIRDEIARQPGAPYYMAQTILVQEHALQIAERRIRELEDELARPSREVAGAIDGDRQRQSGPWDRETQRGGGGFLAGAAQTALVVTGGILIGNAIASMLGGTANAAEPQSASALDQSHDQEVDADAGGDDFGGFGDDGFDFGGDF